MKFTPLLPALVLAGLCLAVAGKDYRLAGYEKCPLAHIASDVGATSKLHCSLLCEADVYCKGFCYSASEGRCKISHVDVGQAGRGAASAPGYNMFWTGYVRGFKRYGDKAYRYFASSQTHWLARNLCWNINASVAIPLNSGENSFVASLMTGGAVWMLADDAGTEGVWRNTDTGATLSYGRWLSGQPDDYNGAEDCGLLRSDAYWNDAPCGNSYHYVCEIPVDQCDAERDDIRCSYVI